jgi:hypothetical protein
MKAFLFGYTDWVSLYGSKPPVYANMTGTFWAQPSSKKITDLLQVPRKLSGIKLYKVE